MPTSVPLQPTITMAGLAAIFNAQSTGVEFALTHIAFGTGQYAPVGNETALQAEKVRVPIAGGGRISPTQMQIYAVAMAALGNPFFVGEVGFFGDDGATLLAGRFQR
jgi:phage-related tail fiber protein